VFNPNLIGKPVIVLSNNDGNAIARSEDYVELDVILMLDNEKGLWHDYKESISSPLDFD
jgi:hypothetical protein